MRRLSWLAEKYEESLANKEKILKEIEVKKEYLSNLQPRLNSIMQASLPVQEYFAMPFDQVHKQYEIARHLPPPLYVLFVQASAYGQACDKKLAVAIEGNVEEAKALCKPPEDSQDDESDSDVEEEQTTKRRRPTLGVQLDDKRKEMLKRHPLSVTINLKCKDGSLLLLTFYYLMNLNVLTVKAKMTAATEMTVPISAGDLLCPDSLLSCLYPGDHGKRTPNPANQFQFDKVGLALPEGPTPEHGILPVSPESQHLFPVKIVSHLVKWTSITYEDYLELPYTKDMVESGLAEDTHLYYLALIERGTGELGSFSPAMESEVNVCYKELSGPKPGYQLLTNQLQRLCVVLDVYLETETHDNSVEGPKEFPQEKMGPSRLKPFKYNYPQGFFSHR
ncbi:putative THO complex subunit 5-like protein [Naja naja]|nr:putative THO complex subunit 5-like protein [Naja naja]